MTEEKIAWELAHKVLDRPYADPDDDLATLARQFLRARERLLPMMEKTMEITIRVRGKADEMDSMRNVLTFDQILQGKTSMLTKYAQEMFGKLLTAPILKNVIESSEI